MEDEAIIKDNRQEAARIRGSEPRPPAAVWPPPPRQMPQTVIVRGPSAGWVIPFFAGKFAAASAVLCLAAGVVVTLVTNPEYATEVALAGLILGAILGLLEGMVFGILASAIYACGVDSGKIGRIVCWVVPIANAVALAILLNFMRGGTPVSIWMLIGTSASAGAISWLASKSVCNRFVERF